MVTCRWRVLAPARAPDDEPPDDEPPERPMPNGPLADTRRRRRRGASLASCDVYTTHLPRVDARAWAWHAWCMVRHRQAHGATARREGRRANMRVGMPELPVGCTAVWQLRVRRAARSKHSAQCVVCLQPYRRMYVRLYSFAIRPIQHSP